MAMRRAFIDVANLVPPGWQIDPDVAVPALGSAGRSKLPPWHFSYQVSGNGEDRTCGARYCRRTMAAAA
jgi:hypothetical protein